MNILITAGNTRVFIDKVRCITNIFTGRTGASIALEAYRRGHRVTLLTSHPEPTAAPDGKTNLQGDRWRQHAYETYDDLHQLMQQHLSETAFDVVIHSAAVSDHLVAGVYAPTPWTRFDEEHTWQGGREKAPTLVDRAAGKVKSDEPELWLRLVRAPKLVDRIRQDWGFKGILVKFKLEVGPSDEELLNIAEQSRLLSQANLIVANTLEGASTWAFLGPLAEGFVKVPRPELAFRLLDALEHLR